MFDWHTSRASACLDNLIPIDFNGVLQCDGYGAYDSFANRRARLEKPLTLAGCWAHMRRGFFEAKDQAPARAGWVLLQIQHLYAIERKLRAMHAGPQLRDAHRSSESRMIVERIHRVLTKWQQSGRILPQSNLGKAIHYALNRAISCIAYSNLRRSSSLQYSIPIQHFTTTFNSHRRPGHRNASAGAHSREDVNDFPACQ